MIRWKKQRSREQREVRRGVWRALRQEWSWAKLAVGPVPRECLEPMRGETKRIEEQKRGEERERRAGVREREERRETCRRCGKDCRTLPPTLTSRQDLL